MRIMKSHGPVFVRYVPSILVAAIFLLSIIPQGTGDTTLPVQDSLPTPPGPKINATEEIESILYRIDENLMESHIRHLQDYKTRYSYRGDKCRLVAEHIYDTFESNGLNASYDDFVKKNLHLFNVIGERLGTVKPDEIVIICAHYDSTSSNRPLQEAPGADDNGSGTAAILAAAELLSDYEFNRTIRFIAFSGEEQGLWGSSHYVTEASDRGDNITGVINLDMIAYNPSPSVDTVFLTKDYNDDKEVKDEMVYGPAPAGDTTEHFWLDNDWIIETDASIYIEEQGSPGTPRKMEETTEYVLNYTTGFIDLSPHGPLAEHENLTAHYNYSVSDSLVNHMEKVMNKYHHISGIRPEAHFSGQSDHAPFSPLWPAIMLIERKYGSNPHYHSNHDLAKYLNFTYCANVTQVAIASLTELAQINSADKSPPSHGHGFPAPGGFGQAQSTISLEIRDPSPINLSSIQICVNGSIVAHSTSEIPLGYNISYIPAQPFIDGQTINVSVCANDTHGHGFNHSWEYEIDGVTPEPITNLTIYQGRNEFEKQGLVLDIGSTGPDVKHAYSPSVLFQDGEYKMWYAGHDNSKYQICYANSSDGINWNKHGVVLPVGDFGDPDGSQASEPSVIYDGEYKMWYSGRDTSCWRVLYANSSDGIIWNKQGIAINVGTVPDPDSGHTFRPTVVKTDEYKMWYTGIGYVYNILYANSSDGITWNKQGVVTPSGIGRVYGDGLQRHPTVYVHNDSFYMLYTVSDGYYLKTATAISSDGINWNDLGLSIDTGTSVDFDIYQANNCAALQMGDETKVWYSGYNNANWRIMYANITPDSHRQDTLVTWTPSPSDDIVRYEVYRESRLSAFPAQLETSRPEFYNVPEYATPWVAADEAVLNISVFGPVAGSDPSFFLLPDDNILNISLFMESDTGQWAELVLGTDFVLDERTGMIDYSPIYPVGAGTTFYASYNHTATKAMRVQGNRFFDVRAGLSSQSYYYRILAVDKVGHRSESTIRVGKVTNITIAGWNLVSSPFLQGPTSISEALCSLNWTAARTWEPEGWPHRWTRNRTSLPYHLNTLELVDQTRGIWVEADSGTFSTAGAVQNITIDLKAGWNLVSYPYIEVKSVSDALAGLPWDRAEAHDPDDPYLISPLGDIDPLYPGQGLWIYLTADAQWAATNI